jgi:hypothetical protein
MKLIPITTRRFDIRTHSIGRTLIQELRFRIIPLGNYYGGPNLFFLLRLLKTHLLEGLRQQVRCRVYHRYVFRATKHKAGPPG